MSGSMSDVAKSMLRASDLLKADEVASLFAEDAKYKFTNADPIIGKANIYNFLDTMFKSVVLKSLHHKVVGMWEKENTLVCELEVIYTRPDDAVLKLPACDIFQIENGLIQEIRIYLDNAPLIKFLTP